MSAHRARAIGVLRKSASWTLAAMAGVCVSAQAHSEPCEDLNALKLADASIVAQPVPAGDYTTSDKVVHKQMPAFCRVTASLKPAPDSDIRVEVWLPQKDWAGVFHGNGNGGFAGVLEGGYGAMEEGVKRNYASATTDMGTAPATVLNGDALVGHPQKWKDWGSLSTHAMTAFGKAVSKAYYGEAPKRSYYTGCSTGGQQGLIEAQYYPDDYDGVLIGAPVVNRTWGHAAVAWNYIVANREPGRKLSDAKLAVLHDAAVAACNSEGPGLKSDPFIADPTACHFDPATLACHGADVANCLTPGEIETAKAFYSGPVNHAGAPTYYGWRPGSETGTLTWSFLQAPFNAPGEPSFDGLFKWVFGANWNWRDFDFDRDMPKVDALLGPDVNGAVTGDVSAFKARGGKIIAFQGWADPIVSPDQTVAVYDGWRKKFGDDAVESFARLYMAPGVRHCGLGDGLNAFDSANRAAPPPPSSDAKHDLFTALVGWVEHDIAPASIVATSYVDNDPAKGIAMQRPLCVYPRKAWYVGGGDPNIAANFTCAVQKK